MSREISPHGTAGQRRLVAIVCADIVGSSRLMGKDEEGTHERMMRYRRDIVEPTVSEHYGQVVKHTGDGFLAMFNSPLEAVRCAIVIQQMVSARNTGFPKDRWIQYRIGINLGDVIVETDDIYGDGVNIAVRLESVAEPGAVNISGGVYEQVKNKLVCGYQSLGDEKLKNITDPVRIYRVLPDPAAIEHAQTGRRMSRMGLAAAIAIVAAFSAGLWLSGKISLERAISPISTLPSASPQTVAGHTSAAEPMRPAVPSPQGTAVPATADNLPGLLEAPALPPTPTIIQEVQPLTRPLPDARAAVVGPTGIPQAPRLDANAFRDCDRCPEMLKLPGGTFSMGSNQDPSERPVHQVTVAPFAMGRYPVTLGEWRYCFAAGACKYEASGEDESAPVSNLSWDDARQYVSWLAQITSKPYRLPTEAEWEYAARAGTTSSYWWGSQLIPGVANCRTCGEPFDPAKPTRVGLLRPNAFGLHDMSGGIAEWVSDCWHNNYQGASRDGTQSWDSPNCREYVLRGGSWRSDPSELRVSSRARYDKVVRYPAHGFRVALSSR